MYYEWIHSRLMIYDLTLTRLFSLVCTNKLGRSGSLIENGSLIVTGFGALIIILRYDLIILTVQKIPAFNNISV